MSRKEQEQFLRSIHNIYNTSIYINETLIGKEALFVTESDTFSVIFSQTNFMHLCGIHYLDGASNFFNHSLGRQINLNKVMISRDGTTILKLHILGSFKYLFSENVSIVNGQVYPNLKASNILRTKKRLTALALRKTSDKYSPISLLNLQRLELGKGDDVLTLIFIDLINKEEQVVYDKRKAPSNK